MSLAADRPPSRVPPGERWIARVYLTGHGDPEVYEHVKHVWVDRAGPCLVVLHYWAEERYRYVNIPLVRVDWWQVMPERFEQEGSS